MAGSAAASAHVGISKAYLFWVASLVFVFPLISASYIAQTTPDFVFVVLVPYVSISILLGFVLLRWTGSKLIGGEYHESELNGRSSIRDSASYRLWVLALIFATIAVTSWGAMKYLVNVSYPAPSVDAGTFGAIYVVATSLAAATGFPVLLSRLFPTLAAALKNGKRYLLLTGITAGVVYFFTYMILVNQILITGYNSPPGNFVPSPDGRYPFVSILTAGPPPAAVAENLIYVPMVLIQLGPGLNFIFQPFELVFALLLSTLLASTIVLTRQIIESRGGESCLTGAAASGFGGFLGFTATCPSCLVPTLISVFFGGFSSSFYIVQSIYSTVYGVLLPPTASSVLLVSSLFLLSRRAKRNH